MLLGQINGERDRFEVAGVAMLAALDWRRSIAFNEFIGILADDDEIDAWTVSLF
jgi:hypothetical protein